MTLKNIIFKILIIIGVLIVLFIISLYLTLSTKVRDISKNRPYIDIIGKEITTKQVCYIAENYKHYVKRNPYILKLTSTFSSDITQFYKIPIGTTLTIEDAKAFTGGVTGFTDTMILGQVFIKELNKKVAFEYMWDAEKAYALEFYQDYLRYPITPWQKDPLPLKFAVEDGSITPYQWPARTKNPNFNKLLTTIWCNFEYRGNRDFKNSTFEKERYETGMNSYYDTYYQITEKEWQLAQLTKVYADINEKPLKYIVGKDQRLNISSNFVSLIVAVQISKDTMEQTLINYDLNGDYMDHVLLSSAHRINGILSVCTFTNSKIAVEETSLGNANKILRKNYSITDNGIIKKV